MIQGEESLAVSHEIQLLLPDGNWISSIENWETG